MYVRKTLVVNKREGKEKSRKRSSEGRGWWSLFLRSTLVRDTASIQEQGLIRKELNQSCEIFSDSYPCLVRPLEVLVEDSRVHACEKLDVMICFLVRFCSCVDPSFLSAFC